MLQSGTSQARRSTPKDISLLQRLTQRELKDFEQTLEDNEEVPEEEKGQLLCKICLQLITNKKDKITINNHHAHQFTNPSGISFQIGCFSSAPGCQSSGLPASEYSWFPGFAWSVCLCNNCLNHVGWHYTANTGEFFFGLILNSLIEPS